MKIRRKMRQKRSHGVAWGALVAVIATCFIAFGAYQGVMGIINSWIEDLPSVEDSDAFNLARKTEIYASDRTTILANLYLEDREPVSIDQVSTYVLEGTVATEDERFYEHNGVDPQGIARALVVNLSGGELEGASTISMQFVRNTLLADEATEISFKRKIREAQLALNLEEVYSKDEILMMYLNTINYGDGSYGIEAAAKNYFSKSAIDLTIAEAATLIGIPQSPNYLNPKINPEAATERRNLVLSRMLAYGTITEEEYNAAVAEPLTLNPSADDPADGIIAYHYFTAYVKKQLEEMYSPSEVWKGGLKVYTTIDVDTQAKAEAAAQEQYAQMDSDIEVALVSIDPDTGFITSMIGGKDFYADQYNLATQAERQPGSSYKVFTLVTAIQQGIDPNTLIDCTSPQTFPGYDEPVGNYDNINYGIRSIQSATAVSSNTGYLNLSEEVGIANVNATARSMGITEATLNNYLAETLGTAEVTVLEMASAYATLAAEGVYREPTAITEIVNWDGTVLHQHEDKPVRVLTEEVAYATTKVLQTVINTSEGSASGAGLWNGQPSAGKTGTTTDNGDKWFCGYTPQLSTAVWTGVRDRRNIGTSIKSINVWTTFMSTVLADRAIEDFATKADPPYQNDFNQKQKDLYEKKDPAKAPNVSGLTLDAATSALNGYEAAYLEEYSDTVAAGLVIRQEVVDGVIILYISKGPDPTPKVVETPEPEKEEPEPEPPSTEEPPGTGEPATGNAGTANAKTEP